MYVHVSGKPIGRLQKGRLYVEARAACDTVQRRCNGTAASAEAVGQTGTGDGGDTCVCRGPGYLAGLILASPIAVETGGAELLALPNRDRRVRWGHSHRGQRYGDRRCGTEYHIHPVVGIEPILGGILARSTIGVHTIEP